MQVGYLSLCKHAGKQACRAEYAEGYGGMLLNTNDLAVCEHMSGSEVNSGDCYLPTVPPTVVLDILIWSATCR